MGTWVFDTETLANAVLVCAREVETGEWVHLWAHEPNAAEKLRAFLTNRHHTFIGFNSYHFDAVVVDAVCAGWTAEQIKVLADALIQGRMSPWAARAQFGLEEVPFDHIDIIEVAPSFVSLKTYGARMHYPVLSELPLHHSAPIVSAQQAADVLTYCRHDVQITTWLVEKLSSELELRCMMSRRYGVDLRSRSDSQMAEQIFRRTLKLSSRKNTPPANITYRPPEFIRFESEELNQLVRRVVNHSFVMNHNSGHVVGPEFLDKTPLQFGTGVYRLGVGGLHSMHDRNVCHVAGEDYICEVDASSFYPSIILECGLIPAGLGQKFIAEYRRLYDQRMVAKRSGDKPTDATLKIALNGTFGKLASRWSPLYSPDLMLAVTLTGQLTLLMLIEKLELAGAITLSANTDGIAIKFPASLRAAVESAVQEITTRTRFNFDYTYYRAMAMKDVNNYIAVKLDRTVKAKGIYAELSLRKNPTAGVSANAVAAWLANGTPLLQTIEKAPFKDFLSARNVTGGGEQFGVRLGKVVRWYMSTEVVEPIRYAANGNLVPKTTGGRALQDCGDFQTHPNDLDYTSYYREAIRIAKDLGCSPYLTEQQLELITPRKPKKTRTAHGIKP